MPTPASAQLAIIDAVGVAPLIVIGVAVLVVLAWFIGTYNGFVRFRQHVTESWSNVDTELQRRYDLIPNLVSVCKGYAKHEADVFERVTQARAAAMNEQGGVGPQSQRETELTGSLGRLLAVSEDYPELKASQNFLELQRELANTEDRIQAARRFYNANVRDLNTRVDSLPSNLVAKAFGFTRAEYFELTTSAARSTPNVSASPGV
ncbi:MAG: LemA family protein [Planctomycetota bacterium]